MPINWKEAVGYAVIYGVTYTIIWSLLAKPLEKIIWDNSSNTTNTIPIVSTPPPSAITLENYNRMDHY